MEQKLPFDYSDWIWCRRAPGVDEYGEFYDTFDYTGEMGVTMCICADSNYAVYVNGKLAACGQYADYPYDKVYDTVDLTNYCRRGKNHLAVVVWYYGLPSSSTYYLGQASLRYAVREGHNCVCISTDKTQSRLSRAYKQHRRKIITGQLGLTFSYDATAEDGWMTGEGEGMSDSVLVRQAPAMRPRPCKKLELEAPVPGREIARLDDGAILYDLGREEVGFLSLALTSLQEQKIMVAYGEHIVDGRVRRVIGGRDFSVEYVAKAGENEYVNPFRRLACRYLEIQAPHPEWLKVEEIAIVPTMYPLTSSDEPVMNDTQKRIYDACVRTLRLCMHEHYEDCPWREQSLYAMDSRNQILCGYYAFGEYQFPRANLELIAKDDRADELLAICYPSSFDLAIPSFSLHFITEAYEYLTYSGDKHFLRKIFPKMKRVVGAFLGNMENGLALPFQSNENFRYWNFYEWREGLQGTLRLDVPQESDAHVVLNCLLLCALRDMVEISKSLHDRDAEASYQAAADALAPRIKETFFDAERGLFINCAGSELYSQLGNSLAILGEVVVGEEAERVAKNMIEDANMTPTSTSMQCFTYDALLKVSERYADYVLADIEKKYLPMLEGGTGTVWETELGAADFGRAGSLCHGWSAMPIYYYHKLLK